MNADFGDQETFLFMRLMGYLGVYTSRFGLVDFWRFRGGAG
jgi:hypothetical protein